jgi:broad specificity phosphatase PhoE
MNDPFLFQRHNASELFLIRHADAASDDSNDMSDTDELSLSQTGHEQSQALMERLSKISIDAIYSSPFKRCLQTAEPVAQLFGLVPHIIADIREIHHGRVSPAPELESHIQGHIWEKQQVELVRLTGETGSWDAVHGPEQSMQFRTRVVDALDAIANKHLGDRVLVFTHAGAINAYVAETLGLTKDFFFPCANASITIIRAIANHRVLFTLNDLAHVKLSTFVRQLTDYAASSVN